MDLTPVTRYFPSLSELQLKQFSALWDLYHDWNSRINVISRKDIDNLYTHHVLHSLGIARVTSFVAGTRIIDVGTGGGFPGIPLAILFPDVHFHLVDSIGKKITVVKEVAAAISLKNVLATHSRSEELRDKADFVVSRAVTSLPEFLYFTRHLVAPGGRNALRNGILYLKGGEVEAELRATGKEYLVFDLHDHFPEPFFEEKKVVYINA